ncbi:MAG: thioredoxin family protein [Promethearchaeota archaeon]
MNALNQLKWSDIVSPTLSPKEYLKKYKKKIKENYESYEPKSNVIIQIKEIIKSENQRLKIVALGADWCPDCIKNIPKMLKVIKLLNDGKVDMKILYGIMVNAFHKPGESRWHKKRSPPEATNPMFDLKALPTFYFFNKDGNYIGTIIERPKENSTLEEDIFEILEKTL